MAIKMEEPPSNPSQVKQKDDSRLSTENVDTTIYIDPEKERAIRRKFDYLVLPQFFLIMLLAYLDRTNIGNARVFGFEKDLGLRGNDFANISSLFYVTYVIFEIPWVMAVKRWGANTILAVAIVCWSAVVIGTAFARNYTQVVFCRLLLGLTEAGVFPAITFVVSTIYPRESQGKRIAVLYGATALAGAFGGLIAYGIQIMGSRQGIEAWRWLFIIEGAISIVFGMICWASLPQTAEKAWFLNHDERQLMLARRARNISYTGEDELSWKFVWMAFSDPMIWATDVSLFCAGIPLFGFGIFLPTIISGLGFESIQVNYLTIPVYFTGCIILGVATYVSDRLQTRAIVAMFAPLLVMIGYAIALGTSEPGLGFFSMFLCSGVYTYNTLVVAWASNNIKPDHKRSVAIPFFISIANLSGVVASQVYPPGTAPRYVMGNSISLAMEFSAACGILVIFLILRKRNEDKDKQRAEGITDNGEIGDKSLDFKYIL